MQLNECQQNLQLTLQRAEAAELRAKELESLVASMRTTAALGGNVFKPVEVGSKETLRAAASVVKLQRRWRRTNNDSLPLPKHPLAPGVVKDKDGAVVTSIIDVEKTSTESSFGRQRM